MLMANSTLVIASEKNLMVIKLSGSAHVRMIKMLKRMMKMISSVLGQLVEAEYVQEYNGKGGGVCNAEFGTS